MVSRAQTAHGRLLLVAPLAALPRLAGQLPADARAVGLLGPDMEHPRLPLPGHARLKLAFHDVTRAARQPALGLQPPRRHHVARLVAFARAWAGSSSPLLLLHCWMGVSRSPAAAFIVQCALHPAADELALARQLRALAPFATPNLRLVALADALLGRHGRMVQAVQAIGRGCETDGGTPFVWPLAATGAQE